MSFQTAETCVRHTHTPTHTSVRADVSLQALHWVSWHCKGHYKLLMVSMALSTANRTAAATLSERNYTIDLFALVCAPLCGSIHLFIFCSSAPVWMFVHSLPRSSDYMCVCLCVVIFFLSVFVSSLCLLLWVIGILPWLFAHSDMEIIAVVSVCYLLHSCVHAAQSLEEKAGIFCVLIPILPMCFS